LGHSPLRILGNLHEQVIGLVGSENLRSELLGVLSLVEREGFPDGVLTGGVAGEGGAFPVGDYVRILVVIVGDIRVLGLPRDHSGLGERLHPIAPENGGLQGGGDHDYLDLIGN
jgi:hypothetical protein